MKPIHFILHIIVCTAVCGMIDTTNKNNNRQNQNKESFEYEYIKFFTTDKHDGSENKYIPYDYILTSMAFPQTSKENNFKEAIDYAMKFYEKNSIELHYFAGAAFVIYSIHDSIQDINVVNDLKKAVSFDFTALAKGEISENYFEQALAKHRKTIDELKFQQLWKGGIKGFFSCVLAYFGWKSENPFHQAAYYTASVLTAASSVTHGFNYYKLNSLLERMKEDGLNEACKRDRQSL